MKAATHIENKKEKIFISYRFSGENIENLEVIMGRITKILEIKGYNFFCSLYKEDYFKKHNLSKEQRYAYYKQNVKDSDIVLFFIKSADKSGGMEFELNQAIQHGKQIILAIQEKLDFPDFRDNANNIIEYNNLEQFYEILDKYSF
jgi:hypothetical protein